MAYANKRLVGIYLIRRKDVSETDEPEFYIGKSNSRGGIFQRFNEHCTAAAPVQRIDIEINRLGVKQFTFEILETLNGKKKDIDAREQFWINKYIELHGESKMYNGTSGGVEGAKSINKEHKAMTNDIKKKIKKIFKGSIDYSIYLIAEHYNLLWSEVVEIRKTLIKSKNIRYDSKKKYSQYRHCRPY